MRRRSLVLPGIVLAVFLAALWLTLPPRPRLAVSSGSATTDARGTPIAVVRGAYHVHTTRSDGSGTVDEVAAAAARGGLQFVLFTDHGDGTRAVLPPAYRSGVLCIDAVEISTTGGHYVALGLQRTPYRLAGEPRDVVEDVDRFGGFGIVAHPDSPKSELAWTAWDLPFGGLEWLNLDTEWRDESRARLLWGLAQHLVRPAETVASLIAHSSSTLERWDALAKQRRVVGLAAVDAHSRFGVEGSFRSNGGSWMAVPSYETSFRTLHVNVELAQRLTGRAGEDTAAVVDAMRRGRVFSSVDALAPAGRLELEAESGGARARMGEFLAPSGAVMWSTAAAAPAGTELRLVCDGRVVAAGPADRRLIHTSPAGALPGSCRLEAGWASGARVVRWLVTNPIYLRSNDSPQAARALPLLTEFDTLGDPVRGAAWVVEHDPGSKAIVHTTGARLEQRVSFTYALRGGGRSSQFAALTTPDVESLRYFPALGFTLRSDRPMRISVQVREPLPGGDPRRWRRSFYLDSTPRDIVLPIDDMRPVAPTIQTHPTPGSIQSLLFVVDTENSPPGAEGTIWIERLRAGQ